MVTDGNKNEIEQLLQNYIPSEVLVPKPMKNFNEQFGFQYPCFYMEDWAFETSTARQS